MRTSHKQNGRGARQSIAVMNKANKNNIEISRTDYAESNPYMGHDAIPFFSFYGTES